MGAGHRQTGLSLVELLAAAAVLVVTAAAGTGILGLALATDGEGRRCRTGRDAAAEFIWSLGALPYCASAGTPSVVSTVFPHAAADRDRDDAFFCSDASGGWPAASFVTRHAIGGRRLVVVARFLRRGADGALHPVEAASLRGADFTTEVPPPALSVELRSADRTGGPALVARVFVADALQTLERP